MGCIDEEQAVFEQLTSKSGGPQHLRGTLNMGKCLETESPLKMMKNAFHLKYSSRSHYGILFP